MRTTLPIALLALALAAPVHAQEADPKAAFLQTYADLAALLDQEELSALEMAQGTYLGARFFGEGVGVLPDMQREFLGATTRGEGILSGLFLINHGGPAHRDLVRSQLERSAPKRRWVWDIVGNEQVFFANLESGQAWRNAAAILPSAAKCRAFAQLCLASPDVLTRRVGLYWGYWLADPAYWKSVNQVSRADKDVATRRIAARLLNPKK